MTCGLCQILGFYVGVLSVADLNDNLHMRVFIGPVDHFSWSKKVSNGTRRATVLAVEKSQLFQLEDSSSGHDDELCVESRVCIYTTRENAKALTRLSDRTKLTSCLLVFNLWKWLALNLLVVAWCEKYYVLCAAAERASWPVYRSMIFLALLQPKKRGVVYLGVPNKGEVKMEMQAGHFFHNNRLAINCLRIKTQQTPTLKALFCRVVYACMVLTAIDEEIRLTTMTGWAELKENQQHTHKRSLASYCSTACAKV